MLMSNDCASSLRRLRGQWSHTPIEILNSYAENLYQVTNQPPIIMSYTTWPNIGICFTTSMIIKAIKMLQCRKAINMLQCRKAIKMLRCRKAMDHIELQARFPPQCTMHIVLPIHKGRESMDPNTYKTIMIDHALAKLCGTIMEV